MLQWRRFCILSAKFGNEGEIVLFRIILYEWCFSSLSRMQMMSSSFSGIKLEAVNSFLSIF